MAAKKEVKVVIRRQVDLKTLQKKLGILNDALCMPLPLGWDKKTWYGARTALFELRDLLLGTKSFDKPRARARR